jgi:hypothetical protein
MEKKLPHMQSTCVLRRINGSGQPDRRLDRGLTTCSHKNPERHKMIYRVLETGFNYLRTRSGGEFVNNLMLFWVA